MTPLLRVAQTKGAISNKEMELFLAPAPKDWQDEASLDRSGSNTGWSFYRMSSPLGTGEQVSRPGIATADRPVHSTQQGGGNFADADAIVGIN